MFSNDPQFEMNMVSQISIFRGEPTFQAQGVQRCTMHHMKQLQRSTTGKSQNCRRGLELGQPKGFFLVLPTNFQNILFY